MKNVNVVVGYWVERTSRKLSLCPTSFTPDWAEHVTKPGRYPLAVVFFSGFREPKPCLVEAAIDSEIVNVGLPGMAMGPSTFPMKTYPSLLPQMVKEGCARILPGMGWSLDWVKSRGFTWSQVHAMGSRRVAA